MKAPDTIRLRRDFLAANQGRRVPTAGFVLLVRQRGDNDARMRAGFTVTKKIGNSVVRNRLKRRLREAVRLVLPDHGHAGADHVLIGRDTGLTRDFAQLQADLARALAKAHLPPPPPKARP
jgi:ribonuclease P protein component